MNIKKLAKSIARKKPVPITKHLNDKKKIVNVEDEAAIYLFWYKNDDRRLQKLSRKVAIKGPRKGPQSGPQKYKDMITYPPMTWDWNMKQDYVCLYVGKSTRLGCKRTKKNGKVSRLPGRLKQHLWPARPENIYLCRKHAQDIAIERIRYKNNGGLIRYKPNTSCQFRSGFDFLYRKQPKTIIFDEIRKRIYMTIHYEENFATRFYLEDYLIGMLQPWFNLDAER